MAERKEKAGTAGQKSAGIFSDIIETFTADTNILYEEDRLDAEFDVYMFMRRIEKKGSKFSMVGMWEVGTPHMKLKVFQLENIMRWAVPRLHAHFADIGFQPEILVSQWFMTHFSYTIPLHMLLRLYDYTFLLGWPGVYRVSIALLMAMEEQLLAFDLDDLGKAMRNFRTGTSNMLVKHLGLWRTYWSAPRGSWSQRVLQQLQENFALEMISAAEVAHRRRLTRGRGEEDAQAGRGSTRTQVWYRAAVWRWGCTRQAERHKAHRERPRRGGAEGLVSSIIDLVEDSSKSLGVLSGREASNWLMRYGDTLEGGKALEMLRIRDELKGMEVQIDKDKQNIQEKIVNACEVCPHCGRGPRERFCHEGEDGGEDGGFTETCTPPA